MDNLSNSVVFPKFIVSQINEAIFVAVLQKNKIVIIR